MICGIAVWKLKFRYFQCDVNGQSRLVEGKAFHRSSDPNFYVNSVEINTLFAMQ